MMPARCIYRPVRLPLAALLLGAGLVPAHGQGAGPPAGAGPDSVAAAALGPDDGGGSEPPVRSSGLEGWPAEDAAVQVARETRLLEALSAARLAAWHDAVASSPHVAGSLGDARLIAWLAATFRELGLEVEVQPFVAYLARPLEARLALVSPAEVELSVREAPLPGLPSTNLAELDFGWNAYSGSGDVEGELVYANYGRREDFEALARLGVDCRGKLVIARYGGNYRGFKAKYAEEAGAAGLVIYTDPRDSGYGRGFVWPEGGWANDACIQRGSIVTLPWIGDPLTPGVEATEHASRLDPETVALPRIPVQPVGWAAAMQLLAPMRGESAPQDWQGGLPLRYRLTGGPDVRARLTVRQERALMRSANVLATLRGRDAGGGAPEAAGAPLGARVIVGCHHDAWGYGASDPTSGLIALLEAARVAAEDARTHGRLRRSLTFAAFGAEEFGIIGSAEYVESRRAELTRDGVLYVNLDAAANGLVLSAAATPEARALVAHALARVPQPTSEPGAHRGSVLETFAPELAARGVAGAELGAPFGELGGGSDHAPFLALTGIPGVHLSAHGAEGTAYHSIYDDLAWYRATVGADYASARLISGATLIVAARAAEAPLAPIGLADGPEAALRHLAELEPLPLSSAAGAGSPSDAAGAAAQEGDGDGSAAGPSEGAAAEPWELDLAATRAALARVAVRARALEAELVASGPRLAVREGQRRTIDELLLAWPRAWLDEAGLPGRTWFKNLYVAPDETSGYASWTLPALRKAILAGDLEATRWELGRIRSVAAQLTALAMRLEAELREGE